jgi:hypothetical protein
MTPVSNWAIQNAAKLAAEFASYGVNCIRTPTNNDRSAGYIARLKTWTDALAAKGIRTLLCPFGGLAWAPNAANGNLVADQWIALGKPTHVLVETVNEPNPQAYGDDPAAWKAGTAAEVAAIRAKGYSGPIICGTRNWCWTIPITEAKQLLGSDPNLVFIHHRYSYDGSTNRPASDATSAFPSEMRAAASAGLCVGVGEWGWYNNGGVQNAAWLQGMADQQVALAQSGDIAVALSWMYLWDQNSHIVANDGTGGFWPITSGSGGGWKLNQQGTIAKSAWSRIAALVL